MRPSFLNPMPAALSLLAAALVSAPGQTAPPPQINFDQLVRSQMPIDVTSPVTANVSFDPPVVRPGEISIYRVQFNALEAAIRWPGKLAAPAELHLRESAHGQFLKVSGGEFRPYTTFNYHASAAAAGTFTVPAFTVEVYGKPVAVPAARLEVRPDLGAARQGPRRLILEATATNAFVGEPVGLRVLLPAAAGNVIEMLTDAQLNGAGFMVDQSRARNSIQRVVVNGQPATTFVHEVTITPIAEGNLVLSAQGFTAGRQFRGPVSVTGPAILPGGPQECLLLDSDPVTINVLPLPVKGRLAGFTGAVGNFTCDPPQISTNTVRVGQPVQLTVTIRGQGDLERLVPPPPPAVRGWQAFPVDDANQARLLAAARFRYTLIPLTDEVRATPAIPFSYFDPKRAAYVDLTIPSVPVTVLPGGALAEAETPMEMSGANSSSRTADSLSDLARARGFTAGSLVPLQLRRWFPLLQILPALGFGGLWFWDRRRRFWELHPDLVRRRRARRRLRREKRLLRRAASDGDASGFTRRAVNALKIACAPRLAAEPQALVCGDVLETLTAAEREGRPGEIVRRFFDTANAAAFAVSPPRDGELLALKPELEEILSQLEARL